MIESISFCVIDRGQPASHLRECLESIRRQGVRDYEILMSGSGRSEEKGIRYLDMEPSRGRGDGTNRMRNIFCASASKEFIALMDADVELRPDWYRHMSGCDCFDLIGSGLTATDKRRVVDWAYKFRLNGRSFILPLRYDEWNPGGFVNASLMVARRGVFEKVRFNESPSSEEEAGAEFCLRAGENGFRVGVCGDAGAVLKGRVITFDESVGRVSSHREALVKGSEEFLKRNFGEALRHYEKVVEVDPSDHLAWSRMGWSHYFRQRFEEAIPDFSEALKLSPGYKDALLGRGWALSEKGDFDAAVRDLSEAIKGLNGGEERDFTQQCFRGRGWANFKKGDLRGAVEDFERALEHTESGCNDVLQDIYRGMGWALYRSGNFVRSIECFDRAVEAIGPHHDRALLEDALKGGELASSSMVGMLLDASRTSGEGTGSLTGNITESLRGSLRGSIAGSLRAALLWRMGREYYLKSRMDEAFSNFNEAIRLNPKDHSALTGRGWVMLRRGRFDDAIDDFERALEYRDEMGRAELQEAFRGRGWAYYQKGRFPEAIEDFNTAIGNTDADDAQVLHHIFRGRSWAYYRLGRVEEAIEDLRRTGAGISAYQSLAKRYLGFRVFVSAAKHKLKEILRKDTERINIQG